MEEIDLLGSYLEDIKFSQPLSREREAELTRRIREGNESALEELVNANLKFVIEIAQRYQYRGLDLIELIAEGNFGLIEAARRFDETRGFKFITYAVWWIKQGIRSAIRRNKNVRRPNNRLTAASKVMGTYDELSVLLGRDPSYDEIAERLDMDADDVEEAILSTRRETSLDALFDDEEEDRSLYDLISSDDGNPVDELEYSDLRMYVDGMLEGLPDKREAIIIREYFGFDGAKPMTMKQIGDEMGLTRERIRQLKEKAFKRIREGYRDRVEDEVTY